MSRKNTETYAVALGQVLKEIRVKREMSQERVGMECEMQQTIVSKIERGKILPSIHTLYKMAKVLNVSTSDLVARAEEIMEREAS